MNTLIKELKGDIKNLAASRKFRLAAFIFFGVAVALFLFQAGVEVGYRKASFSHKWGDNYERNFGGRGGHNFFGVMGMMRGQRAYLNAYGISGKVISITGRTMAVSGGDAEKLVNISGNTIIRRFNENIKPEELIIGETVVVIGQPDESGVINASLVRIMPNMMSASSTSWQ